MPWEKRTSWRIEFEEDEQPLLLISLDERTTVQAQVLDISKGGLKIALPEEQASTLTLGTELRGCTLFLDQDDQSAVIPKLVVAAEQPGEGTRVLRLQSGNDASRAQLWYSMESLRSGVTGTPKSQATIDIKAMPPIPGRGIYTEEARLERLEFARRFTDTPLDTFQTTNLKASKLTGNIENFCGGVEIPVGLVGPLTFCGEKTKGAIVAPFATSEGALVASASRGAAALSQAGGVVTQVIAQRMMRVPLFVLDSMDGVFLFANWVRDHTAELQRQVRMVSKHANLVKVTPHILGNMVHVGFLYETGDAAGQNMVTACTWQACQWMMKQMKNFKSINITTFGIDSNMSGDKKVNFQSFIVGRGIRVVAETFLPSEVLERVLKVTPETLFKGHHFTVSGSLQVGMVGYNMNIANVIAAIFTATGQDIASVHESALGHFDVQLADDGVFASMLLPSLIIGTVGGGTHLPQQNELLQMLGCAGPGKVSRLAEIIAGFCLALDLSTLAAGVSGQFATAHERLGRSRPVVGLKREELTPAFFERGVRRALNDERAEVLEATPVEGLKLGSSIITELSSRKADKLIGLLPYTLRCRTAGDEQDIEVLVKIKPLDREVILMGNRMAGMCNAILAQSYNRFKEHLGATGCHVRELAVCSQTDPRFTEHMPRIYGAVRDDKREAYVLVMERLQNVDLLDSADDVSGWGRPQIEAALSGAAAFHSVWYGREEELKSQEWIGPVQSTAQMTEMIPLWEAMGVHASEEFPEWITQDNLALHRQLVTTIPRWWQDAEAQPRTLIHNDFNPRNICLRRTGDGPKLCAFDWELATLHLPQHDLAELLCFVLDSAVELDEIDHYVEFSRAALERETESSIDARLWRRGFRVSLYDLTVNRLALYGLAHTFRHYPFMEHTVTTLRRLIHLETKLDL
jgi:hydroxymethylglutaryl-CoA reductase (NADPH)